MVGHAAHHHSLLSTDLAGHSRRVTVPPSVRPLLAVLVIAVLLMIGVVNVEDASARARLREDHGLTRGSIVDIQGRPLAWTDSGGARRYAFPSLAFALGHRLPNGAWTGLESQHSNWLNAGSARRDWRTFFLHLRGRSAEGNRLQVTIDSTVQAAADRALGTHKGAIVAVDPRTGGVLAYLSKPYCSPDKLATTVGERTCEKDSRLPLLDRARNLLVPPGSSFKIVTLSAAIDSGKYTLASVFTGADAWGPSPYFDNTVYPSNVSRTDLTSLTLAQALAFSDNFTFAHIAVTLGPTVFLHYAHLFHLDSPIPFDYPVKASTVAGGRSTLTTGQLARSAFGAEDDQVTPMQMANIVSTVANRGQAARPHLVAALESPNGKPVVKTGTSLFPRAFTRKSATEVAKGMEFVVLHGSGYNAQIPHIRVGGKTGTAASGAYFPHAWFIAFAPINHPVVAVAVLREFAGEAFKYAAPIARKVLIAALRERGYHVK